MPVRPEPYRFNGFPPFFDGLLPEGFQLEALLRQAKLDRHDYLGQLLQVGSDMVGSVTVFSG
jgi:serine/threonine-protein kinase HipA